MITGLQQDVYFRIVISINVTIVIFLSPYFIGHPWPIFANHPISKLLNIPGLHSPPAFYTQEKTWKENTNEWPGIDFSHPNGDWLLMVLTSKS